MPTARDIQPAFFAEKKPAVVRIWHWLSGLLLLFTLSTVLFASTLFETKDNIGLVMDQVSRKGGIITKDQARGVAHEYSDKLWMLHKYIGYGLAALFLWRIISEARLSREKKLSTRIRTALNLPASPDQRHYLWVQFGHVGFYMLFGLMALTGLVLAFEDQPWLDPVHEAAKTLHSIIQYALYAYILAHLIGAIHADLTKHGGIVSRMINGKPEI